MSNFLDNVEVRSDGKLFAKAGAIFIGSAAGAQSLVFSNTDGEAHLVWNPTANRTISLPDGGGALVVASQALALAAGTQTATSGTVVMSDSNGVSFGLSGSTRITASVDAIKSISAGGARITNGEAVFSNSNGVAFGVNGQTLTASYSQSTAPGAIAGGTQTATSGTIVFSNSNGVSFGLSGSTRMTAGHDGLRSISAGGQDSNVTRLVFGDGQGITFGLNNGTLTATIVAGAAAGIAAVAAGTQTQTSGTLVFSDSNGISFGLSGSTRLTASNRVESIAIAAGTQTWTGGSTLIFANSNGLSWGLSGSSRITADPGGIRGIQVPGGLIQNGSCTFTNANGVSFGQDGGGVITASIDATPLNSPVYWNATAVANVVNIPAISSRPIFTPFFVDRNVTWTAQLVELSRAATGVNVFTVHSGLYRVDTAGNPANMTLDVSQSWSFSQTNTASNSGLRVLLLDGLQNTSASMGRGYYVAGLLFRAASTSAMNYSLRGASTIALVGLLGSGADNVTPATSVLSNRGLPFAGRYSANSSALPAALAPADIQRWTSHHPWAFTLISS